MLPPSSLIVFLVKRTWNSLPLGRLTFLAESLPNKLIIISSVHKTLLHHLVLTNLNKIWRRFGMPLIFFCPSKGIFLAILPGKLALYNLLRTVRYETVLPISAEMALEEMNGMNGNNAIICCWWGFPWPSTVFKWRWFLQGILYKIQKTISGFSNKTKTFPLISQCYRNSPLLDDAMLASTHLLNIIIKTN